MGKVKIKKNDQVQVVSGKDRGARGKVLRVFPGKGMALVEGINMVKRHTRPNPQKGIQGGIVDRNSPISVSNLLVVCPHCGKPARLGRVRQEDGSGARRCRRCEAVLS